METHSRYTLFILLSIVGIAALAGGVLYPSLPARMASHWNEAGEVNGTMGKFWGVAFLPLMMAAFVLIYRVIPAIDPLHANIERFRKNYDGFWIVLLLFFLYLHGLQLAWNMGARFNFGKMILPALAVLWYAVGTVIEKSKRNWFMGIRTPWTLSSDEIWEKTHRLGGKLFRIAGLVALLGFFFESAFWFVLVPIFAVLLSTIGYSYLLFRKSRNRGV